MTTIIMAVYNSAPFVISAVESVLNQEGTPFHLVICDDASSDDTWTLLQRYGEHPQVALLRNECNRGPSASRNRCLEHATGDFVLICDGDDLLLPGALSTTTRILDANSHLGIVYGDLLCQECDERGNALRAPEPLPLQSTDLGWDLLGTPVPGAGTLTRRALLCRVGGYDERLRYCEDWDLWLRVGEHTESHHERGTAMYVYRRHPRSITRSIDRELGEACRRRIVTQTLARRYGVTVPDSAWE